MLSEEKKKSFKLEEPGEVGRRRIMAVVERARRKLRKPWTS